MMNILNMYNIYKCIVYKDIILNDWFLVMTKYERNLWTFLSEKSCSSFNMTERFNLTIDLCLEVEKVHEECLVQRDIKPTNIMINANGEITLVDFGIGNIVGDLQGSYGTPGFLAPEQFSRDKQNEKVDIWALGKVIVLIIFEWRSAWQLLWAPKFLTSAEIRSLGSLSKIFDLVKEMIEVNLKINL